MPSRRASTYPASLRWNTRRPYTKCSPTYCKPNRTISAPVSTLLIAIPKCLTLPCGISRGRSRLTRPTSSRLHSTRLSSPSILCNASSQRPVTSTGAVLTRFCPLFSRRIAGASTASRSQTSWTESGPELSSRLYGTRLSFSRLLYVFFKTNGAAYQDFAIICPKRFTI